MAGSPFVSRRESFARIGSTNDVVRAWLADGVAEVCLAVADEQTAGRGRAGRSWTAPPGAGLLLSVGFRPTWLEPDRTWQLAAIVALSMASAAESVAGLPERTIRLKWPNDLVIGGSLRAYPAPDLAHDPAADLAALAPASEPAPGPAADLAALQPVQPNGGPRTVASSSSPVLPPLQPNRGMRALAEAPDRALGGFVARPATNGISGPTIDTSTGLWLSPVQRAAEAGAEAPEQRAVEAGADAPEQRAGEGGQLPPQRPGEGAEQEGHVVRKLGGLLGETVGLGTGDPRAIVGLGLNADWAEEDFPPELAETMTSLRAVSADDMKIDHQMLLGAFLDRLEAATVSLRTGRFDAAGWVARQLTNGRPVRLSAPDGSSTVVRALGVDVASGGLIVADVSVPGGQRTIVSGEIVHLRLADELRTPTDLGTPPHPVGV